MDVNCGYSNGEELKKESESIEIPSRNKNPFLVDDGEDQCDASAVVENESDDTLAKDLNLKGIDLEFMTAITDSLYLSESDSLVTGAVDGGELFPSSVVTSGVECFDSSDIEVIKEDRGSGDSIEILETFTSVSANLADITEIYGRTFQQIAEDAATNLFAVSDADIEKCTVEDLNLSRSKESFPSHSLVDAYDNGSGVGCSLQLGSESRSRADTPLSNTSDSSHSGALPNVSYSKLQESTPSSYSPSPYESPTHGMQSHSAPSGNVDLMRPDSLSLPKPLQLHERQKFTKDSYSSSLSEYSSHSGSMDALIEAATSTPLRAHGTVSVEGDMLTFVAHNINELIRKSRGKNLQ